MISFLHVFLLRVGRFQFKINAQITNLAQAEAGEGGGGGGHGLEDVLDGVDAVAAAEGGLELDEDLPVVHGVAGHGDGFVEALHSACAVDHGAALFGEAGGREDVVGGVRGRTGEDGLHAEELNFTQGLDRPAQVADQIFVQEVEGLDAAGLDALADEPELLALGGEAEELEAFGVWVEVRAAEDAVGFAKAGDDVAEHVRSAEELADFAEQEGFLIGQAAPRQ